jgi:hypothetical protein
MQSTSIDLLAALLDPVPDAIQAHDLGQVRSLDSTNHR